MRRLVRLSARSAAQAPLRFVLLAVLIGVALFVYLVVEELSRLSTDTLDEAVAGDLGEEGTYAVLLNDRLGLVTDELGRLVKPALAGVEPRRVEIIEVLPAVIAECPPFEQFGEQQLLFVHDAGGHSTPLPYGAGVPADTALCLAGQALPADAVLVPDRGQQRRWGPGLAVSPDYRAVALQTSHEPITYRISVVSGRPDPDGTVREELQRTLESAFQDHARRQGVELTHVINVVRLDSGEDTRRAQEGVGLVYGVIGWGVIALGGLALLVTQLIVVRDRTWFFGLARALGGQRRHVAALVVLDVVLVLVAGLVVLGAAILLGGPIVGGFVRDAFAVELALLDPGTLARLVPTAVVLLIVAAGYPTWKAVRLDPLEVLERS